MILEFSFALTLTIEIIRGSFLFFVTGDHIHLKTGLFLFWLFQTFGYRNDDFSFLNLVPSIVLDNTVVNVELVLNICPRTFVHPGSFSSQWWSGPLFSTLLSKRPHKSDVKDDTHFLSYNIYLSSSKSLWNLLGQSFQYLFTLHFRAYFHIFGLN
jgi:hypothetical protein